MPRSLNCLCIGTPNARIARDILTSSSRDDATATVLAFGSMCQAFPLETVNWSFRSKMSMHSRKAAGRILWMYAIEPTASIVRSSTNKHSSTWWLAARWSHGPMRTRKRASVEKLLAANIADNVANVSNVSRRISVGKPHRSPASQTSSSLTYSNALARSMPLQILHRAPLLPPCEARASKRPPGGIYLSPPSCTTFRLFSSTLQRWVCAPVPIVGRELPAIQLALFPHCSWE